MADGARSAMTELPRYVNTYPETVPPGFRRSRCFSFPKLGHEFLLTLFPLAGLLCRVASVSELDVPALAVSRNESLREVRRTHPLPLPSLPSMDATVAWQPCLPAMGPCVGNMSVKGPSAIEQWLRADAGDMATAYQPGSLDTLVLRDTSINLATDGQSARCRFKGGGLQGDGKGGSRIQVASMKTSTPRRRPVEDLAAQVLRPLRWPITLMGWRNVGRANFGTVPPFSLHSR